MGIELTIFTKTAIPILIPIHRFFLRVNCNYNSHFNSLVAILRINSLSGVNYSSLVRRFKEDFHERSHEIRVLEMFKRSSLMSMIGFIYPSWISGFALRWFLNLLLYPTVLWPVSSQLTRKRSIGYFFKQFDIKFLFFLSFAYGPSSKRQFRPNRLMDLI